MTKWIIVVDDDTANLKMAGHILSKNNMRVTALKSGKSFLDYVDTNGMPDLVLLDIKMPEMDAFEVGVSDFIRKPFNPDVLLRRLDNILSSTQQIISLTSEATIDKLTGFLNKKK